MPYKEKDTEKLYYSIGEVADMFKVNASQLRYWENEFDILKPKLNKKGNRLFTPEDIESYKIIFNLLRIQKLTMEGAKQYLKENKSVVKHEIKAEKSHFSEIETKLKKIKQELIELRERI